MTRSLTSATLVLIVAFSNAFPATIEVKRGSNLQSVIDYASNGDTIYIGTKTFEASSRQYIDPLCGNCLEPATEVKASVGFLIKDKSLSIIGLDRSGSKLVTNSGYGLFFINSPNSLVSNLTITGGKRDADGNATDAAIIARNSRVEISLVDIVGNVHRIDSVVVGIGGIFGREGAELIIRECRIENNGWDGIALYRGASAVITDCLIKDGRGAGIGITWDAMATAYRNEVTGYWKGIGAFGTSWVIARNNLVHNNLGWGIIATGQSYMDITNNVVHYNGNCGVAPWSTESRGRIVNNIITENGWREQWVCPCVGVWNYGDWAKWEFTHNLVWQNLDGEFVDIWDQTGLNGNVSLDPMFSSDVYFMKKDSAGLSPDSKREYNISGLKSFNLNDQSPATNNGDSLIYNTDGSRSHIGLTGGPQAPRNNSAK